MKEGVLQKTGLLEKARSFQATLDKVKAKKGLQHSFKAKFQARQKKKNICVSLFSINVEKIINIYN